MDRSPNRSAGRRLAARAVALTGTLALLVALQGASASQAVADPYGNALGTLVFQINGGPVALIGDHGSCGLLGNATDTAHLSGPLVVVFDHLPAHPALTRVILGYQQGYDESTFPTDEQTTEVTVTTDGASDSGTLFHCGDAQDGKLEVVVYGSDGFATPDQVIGTYQLSNVD